MDMTSSTISRFLARAAVAVVLTAGAAPFAFSDMGNDPEGGSVAAANSANKNAYSLQILVSDGIIAAPNTDTHLINGWGIASSGGGPWWVSDNHTGFSTLYDGDGIPQALVVAVPGDPTGIVFAGGTNFTVDDHNGHTG